MRKFALYAAVAATAMAGMGTMTSQAAVKAYVVGGNLGGNCKNVRSVGSGNSLNDILQMVTSGNTGAGCWGNGSGSLAPTLPGTLDNPLTPNGRGNCKDVPTPDCSGNWNCPVMPDCFAGSDCPDNQNPGNQNPGNQDPGNQNPGNQNPGNQNPGNQNPGNQVPGQDAESAYIQQVINLVNEERAKAGLSPVTEASDVAAAANIRAREIAGSFSHTRPNGTSYSTALDESGVKYRGSGENIAYGQRTAAEVMDGWMNSQGHRANILNSNYTKIGVGCYENNGVKYWVQLFTY